MYQLRKIPLLIIVCGVFLNYHSFASNKINCLKTQVIWDSCYGIYSWPNGDKYFGEYKDNSRNGHGTYIWKNGEKYVGEFKDNKSHGQGTYTYPDGNKHVGGYLSLKHI